MRGSRFIAVIAAASSIAVGTATPVAANPNAPLALGELVDEQGVAVAGVDVFALVEPDAEEVASAPAGAESRLIEVGSGVTDKHGRFRLDVTDWDAVSSAVQADGLVPILFTAQAPAGQAYYRVRMEMSPRSGRLVVHEPDVAADADPGWRADLRREAREASQSRIIGAGDGVPQLRLVAMDAAGSASTGDDMFAAAVIYDPYAWCLANPWGFTKTSTTTSQSPVLARTAGGARANSSFKYAVSSDTSLEIGVTGSNGSLVSSASFGKAATRSFTYESTSGLNTGRAWFVGTTFRKYNITCTGRDGIKYNSGYSEWRPESLTGNIGGKSWTPFTCNTTYRRQILNGGTIQVANGQTTTNTQSFSIGGGSLRAQQKMTTQQAVGYSGSKTYYVCGNGGTYLQAPSQTREVV